MMNNGLAVTSHDIVTVQGRVLNYTNSSLAGGAYRRTLLQRFLDALLYGQRVEDCLHMFVLRMSNPDPLVGGHTDVFVNVHGTIAGGAALMDNMTVEVTGRYRNGVLMARQIVVVSGGAQRAQVQFQYDLKEMLSVFWPVAFALVLMLAAGSGGGLSLFISTWLATSLLIAALWVVLISRMGVVGLLLLRGGKNGGMGFPLLPILVIALLITLAIC